MAGLEVRREEQKEGEACECGLVLGPIRVQPDTLPDLPEAETPKRSLLKWSSKIPMVRSRPSLSEKFLCGNSKISRRNPSRIRGRFSKDAFKFHVAVTDSLRKNLSQGLESRSSFFKGQTLSHRKRLVGRSLFLRANSTETKKIAPLFEGKNRFERSSDLRCQIARFRKRDSQAESFDAAGNRTVAHRDVWVAGKREWWFEVGDHDRIDLIPEKKTL